MLLPAVRSWIEQTGYGFLNRAFRGAQTWATIWIAGSGITYQWSAARNPGDLDVLIGVRMRTFKQHNPSYAGVDDNEIAHIITDTLKTHLWPRTANQQIGDGHYEVTWYVNAGAEDIRDINPYAAYNVTKNKWTVTPPDLAEDWGTNRFPAEWWAQIGREKKRVHEIIHEFGIARNAWLAANNPARRINAAQAMQHEAAQAAVWFEDIHNGRRAAFAPTGQGYLDWNNFRWQAHKRNGVVQALHSLAALHETVKGETQAQIYGQRLATSEQALATASLLNEHLASLEVR